MIKKIKVDELRPGMYVHDFNCSWMQHPFLGQSSKIKDKKSVKKVIDSGIRDLYIDTDRGLDVEDAPTEKEVHQEIQTDLDKIAETETNTRDTADIQKELVKAKEIKQEAKKTVKTLMEDMRLGKPIELEKADHVVGEMVDSIFRNENALMSLGRIKKTDEYTFYHSVSVSVLMIAFAKHLGLDVDVIKKIGTGGLLHDVGKMKVPLEILNKPGRLTDDEFAQMKKHAELSREILEKNPDIDEISIHIAAQHHERYDGSGYPDGLKGDEIHIYGQMAAIVDVYDAISSDRCYHKGMLPSEALRKLYEWSEFHFNKGLVEKFIKCMGIYPVGTLVSLESGLLGLVIGHGKENLLLPTVRIVYDTKTGKQITPYDMDLSCPPEGCRREKVENYEPHHKWNLKIETYL
jgi:putative nucleotidyltransferase with HDIG domain